MQLLEPCLPREFNRRVEEDDLILYTDLMDYRLQSNVTFDTLFIKYVSFGLAMR